MTKSLQQEAIELMNESREYTLEWKDGEYPLHYKDDEIDANLKIRITSSPYSVNFSNSTWKYAISTAIAFLLTPISIPFMILLSKVLGREIKWFPMEEK